MAQVIADRRDIDFVLYEQMDAEKLCEHERYGDFNRKTFDLLINEARNFAVKEILPTFAAGDREGVRFEDGQVKVPECYHRAFRLFVEGEWTAMTADEELGGQGLPHLVSQAAGEFLVGANCAFTIYGFVGHSAGRLIESFGTPDQKERFIKKMYTGRWCGTMQLTEPQAGSDVGALSTSASKNADGTYSITGNKVFITAGDHDLTENIIHPVLARIEGAPAGTRGISLFIVPKIWVNDDGSLGDPNDVICTGIEEKMGIHGSATCSMALGSKGGCRGLLLGEANKGMRAMFQMMNEARLAVGFIGFTSASSAYLYALDYARQRLQGKDLERVADPEAPQVPIIHHPDVRRMLLWMKAHVEGMRSLMYFGGRCFDKIELAADEEERAYHQGLLDLLTPVIKAYCSERGFDICSEAMQVYGGYGYTREYPVEQLLRDSKIATIYEGTNGIQAMDLLGRKLGMNKGQVFMNYMGEVQQTVVKAREAGLDDLADGVAKALNRLGEVAMHLGTAAMSDKVKVAFAFAKPFLDVVGDMTMAWMLLWRASAAAARIDADAGRKDAAFYEGQLKSAAYFIRSVLPVTLGRMEAILAGDDATVAIAEESFGG